MLAQNSFVSALPGDKFSVKYLNKYKVKICLKDDGFTQTGFVFPLGSETCPLEIHMS